MNNHSRKIIVICNSDIILKGLTEILSGSNQEEIISLHQVNDLIDYPRLSGYILFVMHQNLLRENEAFLKRILPNIDEMRHLPLSYEEKTENPCKTININDTPALIVNKVNEFMSQFGVKEEDKTFTELSKRETEVLQCIAKGMANKEVADKLFISVHTVMSHRKNISDKIGIRSVSGLTMYAILKRIIDIDEISTSDLI
jgi:DNA-binding CsgD family transcriptional regulator